MYGIAGNNAEDIMASMNWAVHHIETSRILRRALMVIGRGTAVDTDATGAVISASTDELAMVTCNEVSK